MLGGWASIKRNRPIDSELLVPHQYRTDYTRYINEDLFGGSNLFPLNTSAADITATPVRRIVIIAHAIAELPDRLTPEITNIMPLLKSPLRRLISLVNAVSHN